MATSTADRQTFIDKWGGNTFQNASNNRKAELERRTALITKWGGANFNEAKANRQSHIDSTTNLIQKYGGTNRTEALAKRTAKIARDTALITQFGGTTRAEAIQNRENHLSLTAKTNPTTASILTGILSGLVGKENGEVVGGIGNVADDPLGTKTGPDPVSNPLLNPWLIGAAVVAWFLLRRKRR